jgi:two-component sensor histidine kinase
VALWRSAPLPSGFHEHWCQELGTLAELAKLRARLRTTLTGSATVVDPQREHWSERLVLIADELTSNALRHGGSPVGTALSSAGHQWLLAVSDTSPTCPRRPRGDATRARAASVSTSSPTSRCGTAGPGDRP